MKNMKNKLDKFDNFLERVEDSTWEGMEDSWNRDDLFDEYNDAPPYEEEDDDEDEDGMNHIKSILRGMFKNKGIESVSINHKDFDIDISIMVNYKERLSDVVKIFSVLDKLSRDILPQYSSEFDMYTNRQNKQVLDIYFSYRDDNYDKDEDEEDLDDVEDVDFEDVTNNYNSNYKKFLEWKHIF